MDQESFDRLARVLSSPGTRRSALAALLGAGLAGGLETASAKSKHKHGRARSQSKGKSKGRISAQAADCLSPGQGTNISGCNYSDSDFSGQDLSSSRAVGTVFRNADLVTTDLSSSNLKDANFRGANLCGADLSSSTLTNADFRGFANPGRVTNLTRADLHSSGCRGIQTNGRTIFCQTITCNGDVRNDDCPGASLNEVCCVDADCPALGPSGQVPQVCQGDRCCVANGTPISTGANCSTGALPASVCCSGHSAVSDGRCRCAGV
jgi:hypothetical protein